MAGPRRARSSGRRPEDDLDDGADDLPRTPRGPKGTAKDRALLLLSVRWRSREELRFRLARLGFEQDEVERALGNLERVGLIDDERFAREVVKDHVGRRRSADRAIRHALRVKGVASDQIERALAGAGDEEERAIQLAERQAMRLRDLPPEAAYRRIVGMLQRRGYGASVALEATRRALADRPEAVDGDIAADADAG